MLAVAERPILNQVASGEKITILRGLVATSFRLLKDHQFPNGTIPASLGRNDDHHFKDTVWIKDAARAVQFALDPDFRQAFPHLIEGAEKLYLSTIGGLLEIQTNPEQMERLKTRPSCPDGNGYCSIDDQQAPAIKFYGPDSSIVRDWGHNQPDNWGILLLEAGKGIEAGLPVLEAEKFNPGEILVNITSYVANLKVERLNCRSIWEQDIIWSSYSTRRIVLAGLEQMLKVWDQIEQDGHTKGYEVTVQKQGVSTAIQNLRPSVKEHRGDYTSSTGHHFAGDLASLIVLNDIELPPEEQLEIIRKIAEGELENSLGFYRWLGDTWKKGGTEAKWTMGKPILARYYFRKAMELASVHPTASLRSLDHGLDRMQDILDINDKYGYIPELFEHGSGIGIYYPNRNDLGWTRSYLVEAASSGINALQIITKAA